MHSRWAVAAALIAGLATSCKSGPSAGPTSKAADSSWELKGSRLVGCCCSPPCS